jgi:hypothetical protein
VGLKSMHRARKRASDPRANVLYPA